MEGSAHRLVLNLDHVKSRGQSKARGFFFGGCIDYTSCQKYVPIESAFVELVS
jgi:hypothetical protein